MRLEGAVLSRSLVQQGELTAGGPGSGRHKGTEHLNDSQFNSLALKVGSAYNQSRPYYDKAYQTANKLGYEHPDTKAAYSKADEVHEKGKAEAAQHLREANVHPKDFDNRVNKIATAAGKRTNIKMARVFPNWEKQ